MSSKAIQAELLEQRIAENVASQEVDLVEWIFDRFPVRPEDQVLELCCGTGSQSLRFLELLGDEGQLCAVDISPRALEALASKASARLAGRLRLVEANLDELGRSLEKSGMQRPAFDSIFCAYGLYYSKDATRLLNEALSWLKPGGRIAIVGPFGPNNKQLFDLVQATGAVLPAAVVDSSQRFMLETVVPWAAANFESVAVHTMVNPVRWAAAQRVLNYWQNTTFYDPEKRPAFENLLLRHFADHSEFVNEKWVMMVEMKHARA